LPKSALPASLTPLLGRDAETARLHALLGRPEIRLVTITGTVRVLVGEAVN
jgi:hypothetical protein